MKILNGTPRPNVPSLKAWLEIASDNHSRIFREREKEREREIERGREREGERVSEREKDKER